MKAYRDVAFWKSFLASKQDGGDCSASRSASLPPKKDTSAPIEWEAEWSSVSVWTFWRGDKFLVPAGIRALPRPTRNLVTITFHSDTVSTRIAGLEVCGRRKVRPLNYDQKSSFIVQSSTVWFPFF
jgi:hypothetical protein